MNNTSIVPLLPLMCIFNLDYVLWPFWMDADVEYPCFKLNNGSVVDKGGNLIKYYEEVPRVLRKLKRLGIKTALVDYCDTQIDTIHLLKLLDWDKYITYTELYTGEEEMVLRRLREKSSIPFDQMVYFNIFRNTEYIYGHLGFLCVHVDYYSNGITMKLLKEAFEKYTAKKTRTISKSGYASDLNATLDLDDSLDFNDNLDLNNSLDFNANLDLNSSLDFTNLFFNDSLDFNTTWSMKPSDNKVENYEAK